MAFYFASEKNKREVNEDSYCQMELRINLEASVSAMVVADGMGGLAGGKFYSEAALELWYKGLLDTMMGENFRDCSLHQQIDVLSEFSENIFEKINRELYKKCLDTGVKGGTTLSAAIHFWDTWIISNCGDSPVYGLKNGELSLLGEIQNVASQMVKKGTAREGSTLFYQNKNRLTEYLGKRGEVHPCCNRLPQEAADLIIMGSDGAFGNLSMKEIERVLNEQRPSQRMITELFEQARMSGEDDNQTAIAFVREEKTAPEILHEDLFQDLELGDSFQSAVTPFCSYTQIPEEKKELSFKDMLLRHRFTGGKEK